MKKRPIAWPDRFYLTKDREKLSTRGLNTLQTRTFYAKEKKSLAYVIGIMPGMIIGRGKNVAAEAA
jgi:hypothetical protein